MATGKKSEGRKRRKSGPDNPAQSRRFIEAAKRLGVDEGGEAFRKAMDDPLKPKGKRGNN